MQILLVMDDKDARSAITFILHTEHGVSVKEAGTVQEGLACLLDDAIKFDALICNDNGDNQKLFKYLMTGDMQIRCLVLKDPKVASVLAFPDLIAGYVNPANVSDELKTLFAEKLSGSKPEAKEGQDGEYCRIRALTAMQKSPLLMDLFVRLSSQKYVRVFKQGDAFSEKDIVVFLQKKQIEFLYCLKSDATAFATKLKEDMERDFKLASVSPEGATKAAASAQEAVLELGNRIGFTPEVQALARQGMLTTLKTIGSGKPPLAKIVKGILAEKDKYIGSHAILTSQIACSLATSITWSSDTTFQKLTFAAFFHDMIITNNALAQIKDPVELERRKSEFTEEEYKRFNMHPAAIAQMITKFSEVPTDVDMIIAQHHEKPDGSGWPRKLQGQNIAPLSALFIIAHDIVDYIFENGTENIDAYFVDYKAKYSSGHFRKILAQMDLGKIGLGTDPGAGGASSVPSAAAAAGGAPAATPAAAAAAAAPAKAPAPAAASPAKTTPAKPEGK